jgi:predicted TIM-barrel fold metal-dependent hydrolase
MIPVRFPGIKIVMSEGGLGWVPGLLDRLDHVLNYQDMYGTWKDIELTPAEIFQRNFWHCALDDPSVFELRHRIGIDHILMEADYPHLDSSWPNTQAILESQVGRFPADEARLFTWENAAKLFRHPVPEHVANDPNSF